MHGVEFLSTFMLSIALPNSTSYSDVGYWILQGFFFFFVKWWLNLKISNTHFRDKSHIFCHLSTNGQEKLSLMERVREGEKGREKVDEEKCLGCKMGPFINHNATGCIPNGDGDSWNFQISEGPSKALETSYSVSSDPIREQWSMRPAKKRPERERSCLILLVTSIAITWIEPLPLHSWPHM